MARKLIRRWMPDHSRIRDHQSVRLFGDLLHDPNLWHLNRRSVAGAAAVGLFCAFLPIPGQMLVAAAGAILCRVNLPLAVVGVWITNPITIPPIFYFNYLVGETLLGAEPQAIDFEFTMEWIASELAIIWQPLLLGSLVMAVLMSLIGYFTVRGLWRLHVVSSHRQRRNRGKATNDGGA